MADNAPEPPIIRRKTVIRVQGAVWLVYTECDTRSKTSRQVVWSRDWSQGFRVTPPGAENTLAPTCQRYMARICCGGVRPCCGREIISMAFTHGRHSLKHLNHPGAAHGHMDSGWRTAPCTGSRRSMPTSRPGGHACPYRLRHGTHWRPRR
jgi:hypothetical protein